MNTTTHTPSNLGITTSFDDKFVMLTKICNASIATPRRIIYSANSFPLDENTTFTVYSINGGCICHDVTITEALIAVTK